jgi:hypothetical protein
LLFGRNKHDGRHASPPRIKAADLVREKSSKAAFNGWIPGQSGLLLPAERAYISGFFFER